MQEDLVRGALLDDPALAQWQSWRTSERSWLMKMMAVPNSSLIERSRAMICAWMVTSSAVVGSSAMRICGREMMAAAIMTRWRMPPESSCG